MFDSQTGKAMSEAFALLFKAAGIALAIFVPLGAWKAVELIGMLF